MAENRQNEPTEVSVMNQYGLKPEVLEMMIQIFQNYPAIEQVILFGSRAKGTQKLASDIDLCLVGKLDETILGQIDNDLDDLLLPYEFDLVAFKTITQTDLLKHISVVGKTIYRRP